MSEISMWASLKLTHTRPLCTDDLDISQIFDKGPDNRAVLNETLLEEKLDELKKMIRTELLSVFEDMGTPVALEIVEGSEQELSKDKRVVRTKSSGDRVYLIDEVKKTRQWVTNPDILKKLGFEITDVTEVADNELLAFQMGPALYRVENGQA